MLIKQIPYNNNCFGEIILKRNTQLFFNDIFMPEEYRCYIIDLDKNTRTYLTSFDTESKALEYLNLINNEKLDT